MEKYNKLGETWLPVVEFGGIEYVVDIANRQFRVNATPDKVISFYSEQGREMTRAMAGMEWRVHRTASSLEAGTNGVKVGV